jgi:hypothetical protein
MVEGAYFKHLEMEEMQPSRFPVFPEASFVMALKS